MDYLLVSRKAPVELKRRTTAGGARLQRLSAGANCQKVRPPHASDAPPVNRLRLPEMSKHGPLTKLFETLEFL